ncbi:glycosyltransferase family 4 protein [Flavobacteriaceae bacterium]|nr:glycosyltransferase family 4 protein [Flavobacteriaceae bacterium]
MTHSKLIKVLELYEISLLRAKNKFDLGEIDSTLNYLELASLIAIFFPFKKNFGDDTIELLLYKLHSKIDYKKYNPSQNIVLYCSTVRDFGALVQQYLYNLPKLTLIVHEKIINHESEEIINFLKINKVEFYIIGKEKSFSEKINLTTTILFQVKPSKIFLHIDPTDVFAATFFIGFKKITYFINHADHLFWIGRNSFENIIEFRTYGYWFSKKFRGIKNVNSYILPFYPILPKASFNSDLIFNEESVIGVSGANLYKFNQDSSLTFFKIIIKLLKKNKNFVFILCGNGDSRQIKNLIDSENLADRFKIYGFRKDFSNIIRNSDIYFNSYPIGGGLAQLYALFYNIPVVSVVDNVRSGDTLESLFNISTYKSLDDIHDVKDFADRLIKSKLFRKEIAIKQTPGGFNEKHFKNLLSEIIEGKVLSYKSSKEFKFNYEMNLTNALNEKDLLNNVLYLNFIYNIKYISLFDRFTEFFKTIKNLELPSLKLIIKIFIVFFGLKSFLTSIINKLKNLYNNTLY